MATITVINWTDNIWSSRTVINDNFSALNTELWQKMDSSSSALWSLINSSLAKTVPVNTDLVGIVDTESGNTNKKLSRLNIKDSLKTYFDTLYSKVWLVSSSGLTINTWRIAGRSSAWAWSIEEISIWTWLTLSWSTLSASGSWSTSIDSNLIKIRSFI